MMDGGYPLADMEAFLSTVPNKGVAVEIPPELFPKEPELVFRHRDPAALRLDVPPPRIEVAAAMELDDFQMIWGAVHGAVGGYVKKRTGAECPLGEISENPTGQAACAETFKLLQKSPFFSRILGEINGSSMGAIIVIGAHLKGCGAIVQQSAKSGAENKARLKAEMRGGEYE